MLYVPTTTVPSTIGTHAIPEMSLANHRHEQMDIMEEQPTDEFYFYNAHCLDNKPIEGYHDRPQETPTCEEEEDDFFFLNQHQNTPGLLDEYLDFKQMPFDSLSQKQQLVLPAPSSTSKSDLMPNETADYNMASRTFYATINKFARQNHPEYRRRSPYTFLENWHLHSMYSKSQQILLGMPHVRPTVLLSGDDFMFTPPLTPQNDPCDQIDLMPLDWDDEEEESNDRDTGHGFVQSDSCTVMDGGVVMMAAPAPEGCNFDTDDEEIYSPQKKAPSTFDSDLTICPMLDENSWMSQSRHQKSAPHNCANSYITTDYACTDYREIYRQQHMDDDEEESLGGSGLTMSPELVNWYRSEHRLPATITEYQADSDADVQDTNGHHTEVDYDERNTTISREVCVESGESSSDRTSIMTASSSSELFHSRDGDIPSLISPVVSYQSLADIMTSENSTSFATQTACTSSNGYGTVHPKEKAVSGVTGRMQLRIPNFSEELWRTSALVLELAESFATKTDHALNDEELGRIPMRASSTNQIFRFILYTIQIWHVLFICAESILGDLGCSFARKQVHLIIRQTASSKQALSSAV
ncbi:hypothetical protein DFQ28_004057 [Apophysomyces sp. BC1034]|nr:hypothetical protein DFQ30_004036 [Apophysomyces sp. BC1015]KAG0178636.1 hypothetical protein DFQ29_003204 [Apophysomyces sp. BC1021]KAG0188979.1 hypothetical protein DFQ28_004057 [Apophysomyces sp. BC1034]